MPAMIATLNRFRPYAPLIMRVIIGGLFLYHGIDKFSVGISNVTDAFTGWGVPAPGLTAPLTAIIEIVAGAALIVGFGTRVAALLLSAVLVGALLFVKIDAGLLGGAEVDLAYLASLLAVAIIGPGPVSVDARAGVESQAGMHQSTDAAIAGA